MKRFIKIDIGRDIDELIRMPYVERNAILSLIYRDAITTELLKHLIGVEYYDTVLEGGFIRTFTSKHTRKFLFEIKFINRTVNLQLRIGSTAISKIFPYMDGRISSSAIDRFIRAVKEDHCYQLHAALTETTTKYESAMMELARRRGLDVSPDIMLLVLLQEDRK